MEGPENITEITERFRDRNTDFEIVAVSLPWYTTLFILVIDVILYATSDCVLCKVYYGFLLTGNGNVRFESSLRFMNMQGMMMTGNKQEATQMNIAMGLYFYVFLNLLNIRNKNIGYKLLRYDKLLEMSAFDVVVSREVDVNGNEMLASYD